MVVRVITTNLEENLFGQSLVAKGSLQTSTVAILPKPKLEHISPLMIFFKE